MSDPFGEMIPPADSGARRPDVPGQQTPEVDALLVRLRHMIGGARQMPMSASSMINKEEVLSLLDELTTKLPDELRAARWLLKEREEFLAKVRSEGDDILVAARSQSEQMVQRTEVVRSAEQRARQILEAADADSRRMKREAEDYCDQKLGSFEIVLQKTLGVVGAGRAKLQGNPLAGLSDEGLADPDAGYLNAAPTGVQEAVPSAPVQPAPQPQTHQQIDPMTGVNPVVPPQSTGFFDQENM